MKICNSRWFYAPGDPSLPEKSLALRTFFWRKIPLLRGRRQSIKKKKKKGNSYFVKIPLTNVSSFPYLLAIRKHKSYSAIAQKTDRYQFEKQLWSEGYTRVMGLDEVGRGCLCGPVVAAGVILKPDATVNDKLRDSKTIKLASREELSTLIKSEAEFWTIQWCSPEEIDSLNILHASLRAMEKCSLQPEANPDYLLVDGNRAPVTLIPHACLVKGDDRSASIAAASILAKVFRDEWMKNLHEEYPVFGWDSNVGYPTKVHYLGLEQYGYTKHHRKSFRLRTEKVYEQQKANN